MAFSGLPAVQWEPGMRQNNGQLLLKMARREEHGWSGGWGVEGGKRRGGREFDWGFVSSCRPGK